MHFRELSYEKARALGKFQCRFGWQSEQDCMGPSDCAHCEDSRWVPFYEPEELQEMFPEKGVQA